MGLVFKIQRPRFRVQNLQSIRLLLRLDFNPSLQCLTFRLPTSVFGMALSGPRKVVAEST